ncbi:MAG: restriction endonuclease subunit S [Magnetococcales bacterium]|nr:restriction endonuclease subunit S [Magnetococcales bacterium]
MTIRTWIDELPTQWESKPLRALVAYSVSNVDKLSSDDEIPVRLCNYTDVYNNEFIRLDIPFMSATATQAEIEKFSLNIGDIAITKDSESWDDIGIPALVIETSDDLVCGYHLAVLKPRRGVIEGAFLFRCIQAKGIRVQWELSANGVTRFGLPKDEIGKLTVPVPPLPTQRAIASYLDRETARIAALVAAKEKWLELLAEKRRALISHAVTHGLNPNAPMRDSGIPWLGEVPAHWEVTRLKMVAEVRGGLTIGKDYGSEKLIDIPYLRVANVQDGYLDLSTVTTVSVPYSETQRYVLEIGDVLMNEGGDADKLGRGCVWRGEISPCLHQNHVFSVRPHNIDSDWLSLWTSSESAKSYFESNAKQSTNLASISATNLKELPILLPPVMEQHDIVSRVGNDLDNLDKISSRAHDTIALLKERRAALISAAVMGQIDVGGGAT